MITYARIVDGYAVDVTITPPELNEQFNPDWLKNHPFIQVPNGTQHGAVDNGDGTYTNPPPRPTPDFIFKILSKTAFQDYAISQLGGGVTGMSRFTEIMDATRLSSSSAVRFAFARYEAAITFEKENTSTLTAVMASDVGTTGHLTDAERNAIVSNWPVQ